MHQDGVDDVRRSVCLYHLYSACVSRFFLLLRSKARAVFEFHRSLQRYSLEAARAEERLKMFMRQLDLTDDDLPVFRFWSSALKRRRSTD